MRTSNQDIRNNTDFASEHPVETNEVRPRLTRCRDQVKQVRVAVQCAVGRTCSWVDIWGSWRAMTCRHRQNDWDDAWSTSGCDVFWRDCQNVHWTTPSSPVCITYTYKEALSSQRKHTIKQGDKAVLIILCKLLKKKMCNKTVNWNHCILEVIQSRCKQ